LEKIQENAFKQHATDGVIASVKAQRAEGGYHVIVELTFKRTAHLLYTRRGEPKLWASLDRLVGFLDRSGLKLKSIVLEL